MKSGMVEKGAFKNMKNNIMKKIFAIVIALTVAFAGIAVPFDGVSAATEPTVMIDNKVVNFPSQKPYIDSNGSTLVPVRFLSETLGAAVDWDSKTQTVTITREKKMTLRIGENRATVDGRTIKLNTSAVLTNSGNTMVPLRVISEALDVKVDWDNSAKTVKMTRNPMTGIAGTSLMIATTTSTNDTGLLEVLCGAFDKKHGTTTKWVSVGSGEAMEMGRRGDADVLLVHSRAAEDAFITEGYGLPRKDVMYNYFILIGPKSDPAKVKGTDLAKDGFKKISDAKSTFISRADNSGTHAREQALWKAANLSPDAKTDTWFKESGTGMRATLEMANEMSAYTLSDTATWADTKARLDNLELVLGGDSALFNPYGVIVVHPDKYSNLNTKAAQAFSDYLISEEGQKVIGGYRKGGEIMFIPDAK
jgi:tungstate transport system substrate-binding protein